MSRIAVSSLILLLGCASADRAEPEATKPRATKGRVTRDLSAADDLRFVPKGLSLDTLRFRCVGPTRGGRVTAVAGVRQQRGVYYMGATGGGVWKSEDSGRSWRNVSDGYFGSPSIGAIRVAPSDPNVVWVGTGSDAIRSNVIAGCGVYRSIDAGKTWSFCGLPKAGQIGAVEVHPSNADLVFVAAIGSAFGPNEERGVYRSKDGGRSWKKVLHVSDRCGAVDVEFHPRNPRVVYACTWRAERKPWTILSGGKEGGVYRSDDGGDSWRRLEDGLPSGLVGKADLAVSAADPDRLYVLIEAPGTQGGLYVSRNRGDSFVQVSSHSGIRKRPFYYTNVDVSPQNADVVYASATRFYKSTDGGKTWRQQRTTHGDHHDLWIHPDDDRVYIQGNDGGASVTLDAGQSWSTLFNQPTAELYQIAVDDRFPYWLYAGQQDNTTIRIPSLPPWPSPAGPIGYWQSVGGCETGPAIPKPGDANIVYANCKGRFSVFDFRTGQESRFDVGAANMYGHNPRDLRYRFQRVSPIHISPHDSNVIYHASQFVHRTRDGGRTWERISPDLTAHDARGQVISGAPITRDITGEEFYSCLYSICEAKTEAGVIWAGSNDGPISVTRDGGKTWKRVTPPGLPTGGRVQCVEASPHRKGKAYACVLRYMFDDWRPHVFATSDYGRTWRRLSAPGSGMRQDSPARVVREDPVREGLLYCGTEHGLYCSLDDGATWFPLRRGLPVTPVTDLVVHRGDLALSTMGRSFWILDDLTALRQWSDAVSKSSLRIFSPRPAYRMRFRGSRTTPEYPSASARIDYWIAEELQGDVSLEIRDDGGKVVRRISARPARATRELERGRMEMRVRRGTETVLSTERGHRRFVWDLRHGPSPDLGPSRGRSRGPLVRPGTYELRLRVGERSAMTKLEVKMDPRVAASGITPADLAAQETLALRLRDALARARAQLRAIDEALSKAENAGRRRTLEQLRASLATSSRGEYPQPMLIDQLLYLNGVVQGGDRRPGSDAFARADELEAKFAQLQNVARELLGK